MRLADLVYGVWALMPEQLLELQAIYATHLRGEKIDVKAIEASLGRPLANEQKGYQLVNGVAVLGVQGAISPKANLMTQISGGASAQLFVRDLNAAAEDPNVKSCVLAMDTPGGNVLGIPAARDAVRNFGARKPIVTHSDGVLASAGYWIGGAANRVYIADSMVQVGSIGVVYTHTDTSGAESKAGIKKTVVTAGKYKRLDTVDGKLTEDAMGSLQEKADYVYSVFAGNVAEDLGVSVDTVLQHMADGRVFIGQQAIDVGLVDGVSTLDALVDAMATNPASFAPRRKAKVRGAAGHSKSIGAGAAHEGTSPQAEASAPAPANPERTPMSDAENKPLTLEALQAEHPILHTQALAAGAAAERERIKGVREQSLPGHEALIETLAMDGTTTPAMAAMAVMAAQRTALAAAAKAHADDAPKAAKQSNAADDGTKTKAQQVSEAKAYAAENQIGFVEALKQLGYAS
jgi:signal peptide peptidase SppA